LLAIITENATTELPDKTRTVQRTKKEGKMRTFDHYIKDLIHSAQSAHCASSAHFTQTVAVVLGKV
jgi:hypothetical protein